MRSALIALVLAALVLQGCGDSPEHKLALAVQFTRDKHPEKALQMAEEILASDLTSEKAAEIKEQARQIKAESHLALNHLKEARAVYEEIKTEKPNDPEPVIQLIRWSIKSMESALGKSDFITSIEHQKQFEESMNLGETQADLLSLRHNKFVEAEFMRAQIIALDVQRYQNIVANEEKKIERGRILNDEATEKEATAEMERQQRRIDQRNGDIERHLLAVLKEKPDHVEAAGQYLAIVSGPKREGWKEVQDMASLLARTPNLPGDLAQRMVDAIQRIPEPVKKNSEKIAMADRVLAQVKEEDQKQAPYLLAKVHVTLSRGRREDAAKAQVLLEQIQSDNTYVQFQKNYLTSWCLSEQGKYDRALTILDRIVAQANKSPVVLTLHAKVLRHTGDMVRAAEQVRLALHEDPSYNPARILQVEIDGILNRHKTVEDKWGPILAGNPTDLVANRMVIGQMINSKNKEALERHLVSMENFAVLKDEHVGMLIEGYNYLERHDKTLKFADELKRRRPDLLAAHLRYAESLVAQGLTGRAAEYLDSIKDRFPEAGTGDLMMGQIFLARQMLPEANTLLSRFVAGNPDNVEGKLALARVLASLEKVEEAKKHLEDALQIDPSNQQARAILARIDLFMGDTDKAGGHIARIDEGDVDEMLNPTLKAQILIQKDRLEEARNVCNSAVARGNNDPVLRLLLARIYTIEKKPAEAEQHLLALARAQPNNLQVYRLLGEFYETNTDLQVTGITTLRDLQRTSDTYARLALAGVLESQGKPDEALAELNEIFPTLVQKKDEQAFEVANGIARVHLRQKDIERARQVFKTVEDAGIMVKEARLRQIDLSWANPSVHYTTTQLLELSKELSIKDEVLRSQVLARLAKLDKRDQALVVVEEWMRSTPGNPTLLRWKGDMLNQMGRYTDAVAAYREAIARDSTKVGLRARLVSAHLQNYDFPAAEADLIALATVDKKAEALALAEMGQVFVRLGLQRQAARTFEKLEAIGKVTEPTIMFAMGRAQAAIGATDQARERLANVPSYARLYPAAQIELARLEMRSGLDTQARDRIVAMIHDARTRARCLTELLSLNPFDRVDGPRDSQLMQWADETMRGNLGYTDLVPRGLQSQWMRIRVILLDRTAIADPDYEVLLKTLDEWQQMEPNSMPIFKARMAVLARLEQQPKARQLYRAVPQLASSAEGPLLAVVVGLDPQRVEQRAPLPEYFVALATGKVDAARQAAMALETRTAIYRKDLLSVLDRQDITSELSKAAARQMATAVVALDSGLPHLSASLSQNLIKHLPHMTPAHSLLAQALLSQGRPTDDALRQAREHVKNAGITQYLSAEAKIEAGDNKSAIADLVALLEAEPNNIHARYRLAQVYQLAGQHVQSIQLLEKMHADGGSYRIMVANDLAYLLATHAEDRLVEAHGIAKRAQELVEQSRGNALGAAALLDTIGWIELKQKNPAAALAHLNRSIVHMGDRAEVHFHVGMAYEQVGNRQWAKYHLEQAAAGDKKLAEVTQAQQALSKLGG